MRSVTPGERWKLAGESMELDVDKASAEIDKFIERRATSDPDPDEREESYMESVRRYREKERREHLWQRLRFHERMLEAHTATFMEILDKHKAGRAQCEEMLGIEPKRKETA